MCRRSLLANPSPKEGLDPVVSESIRTPCLFPCEPPCDGKHGLCSCQPREARLPPTGIVMEGNLGAAPLRRLHGMPPPPPDGWKHAAVDRSGVVVFTVGPVATGSRRRRLVLRLSQKDALQALFQQNPYPGIATRERLARELGIAESRVQKQADFDDSLDGSHPRSFLERIELQESAKTEGKDACDSGDKRSLPALRPHALPPKEENGGVALRCPWTLVCTTSLPYPPSQPSG
ncbi:hypothetical protein MG293_013376 [Ovis ammon polii]|uniref:Homeobox domain-containing protein n=1 Tax=Ovis ammon polii TaxID=230172 RepID=A0AAD4U098_OVIAM|nr:hypothetical protein MG293_013376 [Ovis ammon polii]